MQFELLHVRNQCGRLTCFRLIESICWILWFHCLRHTHTQTYKRARFIKFKRSGSIDGNCIAKIVIRLHVLNIGGCYLTLFHRSTLKHDNFPHCNHIFNGLRFDNHWNLIIHQIIYCTCKSQWNIDGDINMVNEKKSSEFCCCRTSIEAAKVYYLWTRQTTNAHCTWHSQDIKADTHTTEK